MVVNYLSVVIIIIDISSISIKLIIISSSSSSSSITIIKLVCDISSSLSSSSSFEVLRSSLLSTIIVIIPMVITITSIIMSIHRYSVVIFIIITAVYFVADDVVSRSALNWWRPLFSLVWVRCTLVDTDCTYTLGDVVWSAGSQSHPIPIVYYVLYIEPLIDFFILICIFPWIKLFRILKLVLVWCRSHLSIYFKGSSKLLLWHWSNCAI